MVSNTFFIEYHRFLQNVQDLLKKNIIQIIVVCVYVAVGKSLKDPYGRLCSMTRVGEENREIVLKVEENTIAWLCFDIVLLGEQCVSFRGIS